MEMPISAPKPNSSPSTKRVDALTSTAAASTSAVKRSADSRSRVTMASLWPDAYRLMWSMAWSSESTTRTDALRSRNSVPQSASVAVPAEGRIDLAGGRYRAEVRATNDPEPRLLTCHSSEPESPRNFLVGALDQLAGG